MKKSISIFVILLQVSFITNARLRIPGLSKLKNKIEKEIDRATRLTKENFNKYIKKADDYIYNNNKDIFNFITTPRDILKDKIIEEFDKFKWAEDQEFIKKFVKIDNNEKLKLLNEKILKLYPNTKMPILELSNDLMFENQKAEEAKLEIETFIEEQNKKKGFLNFISNNIIHNNSVNGNPKHYFAGLNDLVKRIAQMQKNMDIISDFLNNLLKI